MFRFFTALVAALLLTVHAAVAEDDIMSFAQPPAASFEHIELNSHSVWFPAGRDTGPWFLNGISLYGRPYGDVGELLGSVVIFGPQTDKTRKMEDLPDSIVAWATESFRIADLPAEGGWLYVPFDTFKLPDTGFRVAVYTRSTDERGLDIGLAQSTSDGSYSSEFRILTEEEFEDDSLSGIQLRRDNQEWLIRAHVSYNSGLGSGISSSDISGSGFDYSDDGTAEGWEEFTRTGAMVRFDNDRERTVDAIYIYAKLGADWFGTDREAAVIIMDERYNIIKRVTAPFTSFNEEGSWARVDVPNRKVSETFYVLVAPHSEKDVQFLLGADLSGNSGNSSVGTTGAPLDWTAENPEADTNWMVRVHYSR